MNNKTIKTIFDGNVFYLKNREEIVQIGYEEMENLHLKQLELIITENLYSFEIIETGLSERMNRREIIQYLIWKMKFDESQQLFTIKNIGKQYFGFIMDKEVSKKIKKTFGKKLKAIRPFIFAVYDKLIKLLEPESLMVMDFGNLTDFLVIGRKNPFFLRKKYNLGKEEKISEIMITKRFIKTNHNIELKKVFSNTVLEIDGFELIEENPFKIVL